MRAFINGILSGLSTRVDGSLSVRIETQEIDSSIAADLFAMRNKFVKVLISDTNVSEMEQMVLIETPVKDSRKVKSDSQRLRAVLYRLWEQDPQESDFEIYYHRMMGSFIEQIKERLDA